MIIAEKEADAAAELAAGRNGPTPSGGDYSEIFYFDEAGNSVDESQAVRCIIRECKNNGTVINEIRGRCRPAPHTPSPPSGLSGLLGRIFSKRR